MQRSVREKKGLHPSPSNEAADLKDCSAKASFREPEPRGAVCLLGVQRLIGHRRSRCGFSASGGRHMLCRRCLSRHYECRRVCLRSCCVDAGQAHLSGVWPAPIYAYACGGGQAYLSGLRPPCIYARSAILSVTNYEYVWSRISGTYASTIRQRVADPLTFGSSDLCVVHKSVYDPQSFENL